MARMVPAHESRVRVSETPDGRQIDVARRRPWYRWVTPLWIAFIITFGLIGMLTGDPPENSGGEWFLVVWTALGVVMISVSVWTLMYRESLLLDERALVHTRSLGPIRFRRAYDRAEIADVRVSEQGGYRGWASYGVGGGTVAFDYGDRTVRVADVAPAEGKRVVAALLERL